jgi:hypothetical protein
MMEEVLMTTMMVLETVLILMMARMDELRMDELRMYQVRMKEVRVNEVQIKMLEMVLILMMMLNRARTLILNAVYLNWLLKYGMADSLHTMESYS